MILQTHPQLKQYIRSSVERAVHELLPPVVERSIKIALTTCEQIVKKDFALDPEESRMRGAAHQQVGFMTAGMALITGREPLLVSITNNIKNAFLTALGVSHSSMDLACHDIVLSVEANCSLSTLHCATVGTNIKDLSSL